MSSRQAPQARATGDDRDVRTEAVAPARRRPLQAKLEVGAADDPLEREADAVADAFVRWQGSGVLAATPASGGDTANRTPRVHRAATVADPMGAFTAPADVEQRIAASRGGGSALPDAQRASFETFFGTDLSAVRVHRGAESADLNRALSARAFTTGTDVFLGAGEGGGAEGDRLLAHELTHVVQQSGGANRTVRRDSTAVEETKGGAPAGAKAAEKGADAAEGASESMDVLSDMDDDAISAAVSTTGVGPLVASMVGLYAAYGRVSALLKNSNNAGEQVLLEALEDVAVAGNVAKGALTVAQAAGATLVATLVPGLDLAAASVLTLVHVSRLLQLKSSFSSQQALVASLNEKVKGAAGDPAASAAVQAQAAAAGTLLRETQKAIYVNSANLAGDLLMVTGSAVGLAGGPFGAVFKGLGLVVELGATLGNWIAESSRAADTAQAREDFAAASAAAGGDKEDPALQEATIERASVDVAFAVDQLFELLAGNQLAGDELAALQGTFAAFGIGPKWLARYKDSPVQKDEAEEARSAVLGVLGAAENPKTIGQKIVGGIKKFGKWIAGKFTSKDKAAAATPAAPAAATV